MDEKRQRTWAIQFRLPEAEYKAAQVAAEGGNRGTDTLASWVRMLVRTALIDAGLIRTRRRPI